MKFLNRLYFIVVLFVVASCSDSVDIPDTPPEAALSGHAVDALIVNGNISVYSLENGEKGERIGQTQTEAAGF